TGRLELELVDEQGQPACGVSPIAVRALGDLFWQPLGLTDGDGRIRSDVEVGTWIVALVPPAVRDQALQHPGHLLGGYRGGPVALGSVPVQAGDPARARLRVPAAALR